MTDQSNPPKPPPHPAASSTRATPRQATSYMAHDAGEAPEEDDPLLDFEPAPHVAPRRNSIGPERQRAFVAHLAACGVVAWSARHIGASMEALYKLRHKPGAEGFAAAWDAAVERGIARLEDGALQRAIEGSEKPIVSSGRLLGWYRVHHEALVMFMLRQRRPGRYGAETLASVGPGHPLYERIKEEVLAELDENEDEVRASIDRFLEGMRERRLANEAILAAESESKPDEDGPDEDAPARPGPSIRIP